MSDLAKVEQRVVQMKFDNKGFAAGVENTLGALTQLQNGILNAEKLTKALGKVDFEGLSRTLEDVGYRFSTMGIMATTVLQNIASEAYYTVKNITSALSVDQIFAGWQKYNDKTLAIQTIMNATGKSIQDVEAEMDKLRWYTDETSYNFVDMVGNIGKFTSAGLKLEDSRIAMQGIANWAATAGVNANEASRAMFQLSQAIGAGVIKGNDWISVMSLNMGTTKFKEKVLENAVALGKLVKVGEKYKAVGKKDSHLFNADTFSTFLSDNWFTSDVFMKTMKQYGEYADKLREFQEANDIDTAAQAMKEMGDAGDEFGMAAFEMAQTTRTLEDAINSTKDAVSSGWSTTWQLIFGNLEEAKNLWGDLVDRLWEAFAASSEVRNEMLEMWRDNGGRDVLVATFIKTWDTVKETLDKVKEGFHEVIPPMTGERLANITNKVYLIASALKDFNDKHMLDFTNIGRGVAGVISIIMQALTKLLGFVSDAASKLRGDESLISLIVWGLGDLGAYIADLSFRIQDVGFFKAFTEELKKLWEIMPKFLSGFSDHVVEAFGRFADYFKELTGIDLTSGPFSILGDVFIKISKAVSGSMPSHISTVSDGLQAIFKCVTSPAVKVFEWFGNVFSDFADSVSKGFTWTFEKLGKAFEWASVQFGKFSDYITKLDMVELFKLITVMAKIGNWIDKVLGIGKYANSAKRGAVGFSDIVKGIGDTLETVAYWGERTEWAIDYATKNLQIFAQSIKAGTVLEIAASIFLLAKAMEALADIPADKLGNAVSGLVSMIVSIGLIASIFSRIGEVNDVTKKGGFMSLIGDIAGKRSIGDMLMSLAVSMIVMAGAMKIMSTIKWEDMKSGMLGFAEALIGVLVFINMLSGSVSTTKTIAGDTTQVVKGTKAGTLGAIAMILTLANAMLLLSIAMKIMSTIDPNTLLSNLTQFATLLGGILVFINNLDGYSGSTKTNNVSLIHGTKGATWGAIGMILALANAMVILSVALKILSTIDWDKLLWGLGAIAVLMLAVYEFVEHLQGTSSFSKFASTMKGDIGSYKKSGSDSSISGTKGGTFGIFAGILLLSVGILILAGAMKIIETIDVPGIIKGLSTIGGLLVEIFAFMWGLGKVVETNGYQLMMAAGAIQTVAVAMLTLVAGIVILWLVPVDEINKSLGIMAATLIGVGAFLKILSDADVGGLLASGGGFALIAAGIVMIALSLLMIANIPSTELYNSMTTLLLAVGTIAFIVAALTVLVQNGSILEAAGAIALVSASLLALAVGLKVLGTVNPGTAALGILVLAGAIVVLSVAAFILGATWEVLLPGAGILLALGAACYVLAAALKLLGVAMEAIGKGIAAIVKGLLEGLAMLINFITLSAGFLGAFTGGQVEAQLIDISKITGKQTGEAYMEGFGESVTTADYKSIAQESVGSLKDEMNLESMVAAPETADIFTGMFDEQLLNNMVDMEGTSAMINDTMAETLSQYNLDTTILDPMMEKVELGSVDLKDLIADISDESFGQFDISAEDHAKSSVEKWQEVYLDQFTSPSFRTDAKKTMEEVDDHFAESLDGKKTGSEYGVNIKEGAAEGLNDPKTWGKVDILIHKFTTTLFDKLCYEAGIKSPSKKAREEVGRWIPLGVAQGIIKYSSAVTSAAGTITSDMFDALGSALRNTDSFVSDNLTLDPTITPLVDTSKIQNGIGTINTLLGNQRFNINGTLDSLSMANAGLIAGLTNSVNGQNQSGENIVKAINSLKGDVKNLGEYISGLEIRMDGEALVGSIARPMDKQLGIRAARSRRERTR